MKRLQLVVALIAVGVAVLLPASASPRSLTAYTVTVSLSGSGTGSVTDTGGTISCPGTCSAGYDDTVAGQNPDVLTAAADAGSHFSGWSGGGCSGTGTCSVSTTQTVTATFDHYTLTATVAGSTGGSVSADHGTISGCTSSCSDSTIADGTVVGLSESPAAGFHFVGWSGDCSGTGACSVTMSANHSVTATFSHYTLTATVAGSTGGSVSADHGTISGCTSSCSDSTIADGTVVGLSETPATGFHFVGWSGDCSGTGACSVTMSANHSVTATFAQYSLTVSVTAGSGTVTSSPAGISCPGTCTVGTFGDGSSVTLTATPASGWAVGPWTGCDTFTTTTCTVAMTSNRSVSVSFTQLSFSLGVTVSTGGSVTAAPAPTSGAISGCTATTCTGTYPSNTSVTLTETPTSGWSFTGWSGGGCAGTGTTCIVTMTAATAVTATFTQNSFSLGVTVSSGGSVTAAPAPSSGSISGCTATTCTGTYLSNTSVTLTETPTSGWSFTSWSGGGCSGTGTTCVVTMTAATAVTATFTQNSFALGVTVAGSGRVDASPAPTSGSISGCTSSCSGGYLSNTSVTLTETPAAGWHFVSWGGACVGSSTCVVSMTGAQSVTATFAVTFYTLSVSVSGGGTVTGGGINCGSVCSASVGAGTVVSLSETPAAGWQFSGWGGVCSSTGGCQVVMDGTRSVTATFVNPTITVSGLPANKTVEATGPGGAAVTYTPPTVTESSGSHPATCTPASGSTFPLGTTNVACKTGGVAIGSFTITVQDTIAPKFGAPKDIIVYVNGVASAAERYTPPKATDAVGPVTTTCTPRPGAVFTLGRNLVTCAAADGHGNSTNISFHLLLRDKTPPPPVSHLNVKLFGADAQLTWHRPSGTDAVGFVVMRSPGHGGAKKTVLYRGPNTTFTDTGLRPGKAYHYLVVAVDRASNWSGPVRGLAFIHPTNLISPLNGQRLTVPPLLMWKAVRGADYYNVQIWTGAKGGTKILSIWPTTSHLQLAASWTFGGALHQLAPGTYHWYVWPGLGALAAARYGPLIGTATFVVLGPAV